MNSTLNVELRHIRNANLIPNKISRDHKVNRILKYDKGDWTGEQYNTIMRVTNICPTKTLPLHLLFCKIVAIIF